MDVVTLAAAKKYVRDSLVGLGAVMGKNATIESIVHQDGQNVVTFRWTGDDGTVRTVEMYVDDGTPIYVWEAGNTYHYGDLAIYASQFYRCIVENADAVFTESHWNAIGTADGNYSIVEDSASLPARFTAADRKMYYSIADGAFWLWDGTAWRLQEPKSITNAEIDALFE